MSKKRPGLLLRAARKIWNALCLLLCMRFFRIALGLLLLASCKSPKEERQGTTFYYYPVANIYYDIEEKQYSVYDGGRQVWERSAQLPEAQQKKLGRKVIITNPAVPVWKDNESHRLIYSAVVFSNPAEVQRKLIEDSLSSVPKPKPVKKPIAVVAEDPKPEEKKSAIARFFQRLFGKKKEKDKEKEKNTETARSDN